MTIDKTLDKKVEDFLKSLYNFHKIQSEVTNVNFFTYIGNYDGSIRFQNTLIRQSDKYAKSISNIQESVTVDYFLAPVG